MPPMNASIAAGLNRKNRSSPAGDASSGTTPARSSEPFCRSLNVKTIGSVPMASEKAVNGWVGPTRPANVVDESYVYEPYTGLPPTTPDSADPADVTMPLIVPVSSVASADGATTASSSAATAARSVRMSIDAPPRDDDGMPWRPLRADRAAAVRAGAR